MRAAISETFPEPNRRLLQRLAYSSPHGYILCLDSILPESI